jgi:hypothetical protein
MTLQVVLSNGARLRLMAIGARLRLMAIGGVLFLVLKGPSATKEIGVLSTRKKG